MRRVLSSTLFLSVLAAGLGGTAGTLTAWRGASPPFDPKTCDCLSTKSTTAKSACSTSKTPSSIISSRQATFSEAPATNASNVADASKGRWPEGCHPDDCNPPNCAPCSMTIVCEPGYDTGNCEPYCGPTNTDWCFGCPGALGSWAHFRYVEWWFNWIGGSCAYYCTNGLFWICEQG